MQVFQLRQILSQFDSKIPKFLFRFLFKFFSTIHDRIRWRFCCITWLHLRNFLSKNFFFPLHSDRIAAGSQSILFVSPMPDPNQLRWSEMWSAWIKIVWEIVCLIDCKVVMFLLLFDLVSRVTTSSGAAASIFRWLFNRQERKIFSVRAQQVEKMGRNRLLMEILKILQFSITKRAIIGAIIRCVNNTNTKLPF